VEPAWAHLFIPMGTRILDGSWRAAVEHWYSGKMSDNDRGLKQVAA